MTLALVMACHSPGSHSLTLDLPRSGISAGELAVVVNQLDPLSERIAAYYQKRRNIPDSNIIRVAFTPGKRQMSAEEFARVKRAVDAATGDHIQAYALAWKAPDRVDCMSVTSAFALGFDQAWCAEGCRLTRRSPYFNSASTRPRSDHGIRPAMLLAAEDFTDAKKLIDRGVRADGRLPRGNVYLLDTSDRHRNVRAAFYPAVEQWLGERLPVHRVRADSIKGRSNILFYFTGLARVPDIATNHYLPGAIADHLTSAGGNLAGSRQMSALRWLEAGATGSYGTVVEPCNFTAKFPHPALVIAHYLQANTLIEAYWKSVEMPGQGVFIGEPLAQPFRGFRLRRAEGGWVLTSPTLRAGTYSLEVADGADAPYRTVAEQILVLPMQPGILLNEPLANNYRIRRVGR
jgi:uncharacterized protein (TIGR03790 family)